MERNAFWAFQNPMVPYFFSGDCLLGLDFKRCSCCNFYQSSMTSACRLSTDGWKRELLLISLLFFYV